MPPTPIKPLGKAIPEEVGFNYPGVTNLEATQKLFSSLQEQPGQLSAPITPGITSSEGFQQGLKQALTALEEYENFAANHLIARSTPGAKINGFVRLPNEVRGEEGFLGKQLNMGLIPPRRDVYVPILEGETKETAITRYRKNMEYWESPDVKAVRAAQWGARKSGVADLIARPLGLYKEIVDPVREVEPIVGYGERDLRDGFPDFSVAAFMTAAVGTQALLRMGGHRFLRSKLGQESVKAFQSGQARSMDELLAPLYRTAETPTALPSPAILPKTTQVFDWVGHKLGSRAFSRVRPGTVRSVEEALDKSASFLERNPKGGLNVHIGPGIAPNSEAAEAIRAPLKALLAEMNAAGTASNARLIFGGQIALQATAAATGDVVGGATAATAAVGPGAVFGDTPEERAAYQEAFPEAMKHGLAAGAGFGLARLLLGAGQMRGVFKATQFQPPSGPGIPFRSQLLLTAGETFKSTVPPRPRLLGEGQALIPPTMRTKPGPPGPQTPDIGYYGTPLSVPAAPNIEGMSFRSLEAQVRELDLIKTGLDDAKSLQQLHDTMDNLKNDQATFLKTLVQDPRLAALITLRNSGLSARIEAIKNLLGKDMVGASEILGLDANLRLHQPFLDPNALTMEPQVMGMLEWAQGLSKEAGARTINVKQELAEVPPPVDLNDVATMALRNQKIADAVLKEDPSAAVGPPDSLAGTVPAEIKGVRPVAKDPLVPLKVRDPQAMTIDDVPTAQDLIERPEALREQMQMASHLSNGTEEQIGRLVATQGEVFSTESPEVPIIQDRAGRLFAELPDPDGEDSIVVEVTDDPTRAMLGMERPIREVDGSYSLDPIKWEFFPSPFSSTAYKFDKEHERFVIDPEETRNRGYIQDEYKNSLHSKLQMGLKDPYQDTISMIDSLRQRPPKTLEGWDDVMNNLKELTLQHSTKRPTVLQARRMFPDLTEGETLKVFSDMLSDYQGMGSFIETAYAQVLEGKARKLESMGVKVPPSRITEPPIIELGYTILPRDFLAYDVIDAGDIFRGKQIETEVAEEWQDQQREKDYLKAIFRARAAEIDRSAIVAVMLGRPLPTKVEGMMVDVAPEQLKRLRGKRGFAPYIPTLAEFADLHDPTLSHLTGKGKDETYDVLEDTEGGVKPYTISRGRYRGITRDKDFWHNILREYTAQYGMLQRVYIFGRWHTIGQNAIDFLNEKLGPNWDENVLTNFLSEYTGSLGDPIPLPDNVRPIHLDSQMISKILEKEIKRIGEEEEDTFFSEMRVGDSNKAVMATDSRLMDLLGKNLYQSQDLAQVIGKELVQNGKDAVMPILKDIKLEGEKDWHIQVQYDSRLGSMSVTDKGHGIGPDVAYNEFVDLGSTLKLLVESSGSHGIAKASYLLNSDDISVASCWKDPATGKKKYVTIMGSRHDVTDPNRGLDVDVKDAPDEAETFTTYNLVLRDDIRYAEYNVRDFLGKLIRFNDTGIKYKAVINGKDIEGPELAPALFGGGKPKLEDLDLLETIKRDSFDAEVYISKDVNERSNIMVSFLNHGLYQFSDVMPIGPFNMDPQKVPVEMVVDIKAKVPSGKEGYPWSLDRSSVRDVAKEPVQALITNAARLAAEKLREQYTRVLEVSPRIINSKYQVVDTTELAPPDLVDEVTKSPGISKFMRYVGMAEKELLNHLGKFDPSYEKADLLGIGLMPRALGVNILGEPTGRGERNSILVNPFAAMSVAINTLDENIITEDQLADYFASTIVASLIHERTHQVFRSHDSAMASLETTNQGVLWQEKARSIRRLIGILEENDGKILNEIRELAGKFHPFFEANPGANLFDKVSTELARREDKPQEGKTPPRTSEGGRDQPGRLIREGAQGSPAVVDSSASVLKSDAELATLRAEALNRAALGESFSKRKKLFQALTPEERFDYLLHRIGKGRVQNKRHLGYLDPSRWTERGHGPKYFGEWMPSKDQIGVLQDAYKKRLEVFVRSEGLVKQLKANADARQEAGETPIVPKVRLNLDDILEMDPTHVEALSQQPEYLDEWVRGFNLSQDAITKEIADHPEVKQREEAMHKMDIFNDIIRSMDEERIGKGPHPSSEPRSPYGGIKRMVINSTGRIRTINGKLRVMGRPYGVLGPRRQIGHPKEYKKAVDRGDINRNVHHILWEGDLRRHQELVRIFNEFEDLAIAAAHNEQLDRTLFLHRQDETPDEALLKLPPEQRYFSSRRGTKKIKIDIAEWLPKLRKLYEEIITQAEESLRYKTTVNAVNYKFDGQTMENQLQSIELATAKELDNTITSFDAIPPDIYIAATKMLSKAEDDLGKEYSALKRKKRTILKKYRQEKKNIEAIDKGEHRREGYVTWIHRFAKDQIRKELRDPYSTYSRFTKPEVKNHFLDPRLSDKEPYHSWVTGWFMYIPIMLKSIHLEPALVAAEPKIEQLPTDMREYAKEWVRTLKGADTPADQLVNKMAYESWLEEPSGLNTFVKAVTGKDMVKKLREDEGFKNEFASSRLWTEMMQTMAGWGYLSLLGPLRIAKMTFTELPFLMREIAKNPVDLPYSMLWALFGQGRGGTDMIREFASWARSYQWQGPRWYSEATYMGVTDSIHEVAEERLLDDPMSKGLRNAMRKFTRSWYLILRASEFWLRASTYYTLKGRALSYGLEPWDAKVHAAKLTNDLIGAYGPREVSPMYRSQLWRHFWMFMRFVWAKSENAANDLKAFGSLSSDAAKAGLSHVPFLRLMTGPTAGGPDPSTGDQGTVPPRPPEPPKVIRSDFGEWDTNEENHWDEQTSKAAEFGAGFPMDRTAKMRHSMGLLGWLLALYPGFGLTIMMAKVMFDEEEAPGGSLEYMMWPFDFSRFNEVASLFFVEDMSRLAYLTFKKHAPGSSLTRKEEKEYEVRKRNMIYALGPLGKMKKNADREERRKKKGPPKPPQPERPPAPPSP